MKKKSLKVLNLNKNVISSFDASGIKGGTSMSLCEGNPCNSDAEHCPSAPTNMPCHTNACYTTEPGQMGPCLPQK